MTIKSTLLIASTLIAGMLSNTLHANEKVSVQVQLADVKIGHAPLYVSLQDANQFRTDQYQDGAIVRSQPESLMTVELSVAPGIYAVSIWHDLDEDGKFSRGKDYWPTDGWGSSGNPPTDKAPSFDDMKVEVTSDGQVILIAMQYVNR